MNGWRAPGTRGLSGAPVRAFGVAAAAVELPETGICTC